ncbi:MAG: hypothetical protein Salg2KO_00560 [Salibacteraceae bacterium]
MRKTASILILFSLLYFGQQLHAQNGIEPVNDCAFSSKRLFPNHVKVVNLGPEINTSSAEYSAVLNRDETIIYYTSRNDSNTSERMFKKNLIPFEDIATKKVNNGSFSNPESSIVSALPYRANADKHEAPVFLGQNDSVFIIYKDQQLWYSNLSDTGYLDALPYPESVNIGPYQRHASMTADGNIIVYSSESIDQSNNKLRFDLFMALRNLDGTWDNPTRLPDNINTPYDEDSPMISADGKSMYYSSQRPGGLGGYDIYYTELVNGKWSDPINLCEPINSEAHDLYFNPSPSGKHAYFSSNRLGGEGDFDIYKAILFPPDFTHCIPISSGEPVEFDAADYVTMNPGSTTYTWDFGDGTKGIGQDVTHRYARPGVYAVSLVAVDAKTGQRMDYKIETAIEVEFESGGVYVLGPDTVPVGEYAWFETGSSQIEGSELDAYYWKANNEVWQQADRIRLKWYRPGIEKVRLNAQQFDADNLEAISQCVTKQVAVLSKDDYSQYLKNLGYAQNSQDLLDENETGLSVNSWFDQRGLIASNLFQNTLVNTSITIRPLNKALHTEGSIVSLDQVATPLVGSVKQEGNQIVYTPKAGYTGTDRFTYFVKAEDGSTASAKVIVTVKGREDYLKYASIANDSYSILPNTTKELNVLNNDRHPEGLEQSIVYVGEANFGQVRLIDSRTGKIDYTSGPDFGGDAFIYSVKDEDGFVNSATVQINVGGKTPITTGLDLKSTQAGEPCMLSLFVNDQFDNPDLATLESLTSPQNGFVKILDRKTGSVVYHPNPDYIGTDAFTYTVKMGDHSETQGVMITVGSPENVLNLKPTADVASSGKGEPVEMELLGNDANLKGGGMKLSRVQNPVHGTVEILDRSTGKIRYTPYEGFSGSEVLSYTIKDRRGLEATSSATVNVTGAPSIGAYEGIALVDDVFETASGVPVVIKPMDNDSHKKDWKMQVASVTKPEVGFASLDNKFSGEVYYVPAKDFIGRDEFVYEVVDSRGFRSRAKVNIRVLPQFDASRVNVSDVPDINLDPVYFNYDDDGIRQSEIAVINANIEKLKQHPNAVIKVVSHCDSRGKESYNYKLSTERAKSTVEYLIQNGLSESRIIAALGLGESDLSNECGDGVDCPDSEHQENRRTEFIVVGTLK